MICRVCKNLASCVAYSIRQNEHFDPDHVEKCDEFRILFVNHSPDSDEDESDD